MVQGSFPWCGTVPCCKGWRDCWDLIQILQKSRQGSSHESMCIHAGLGGGETFLSTSNCTKKFCLDENKPGRKASEDLGLKINGCNNKRCLWKKLGAVPTLQEADGCPASPCVWEAPSLPCDSVSPSWKAVRPSLHQRHSMRAPGAHQCCTLWWIFLLLFKLGLNYTVRVHDCAYAHVVTLVTALFWYEVAIRKHHRGLAGIRARDKLVPIRISAESLVPSYITRSKKSVFFPHVSLVEHKCPQVFPLPSSLSVVSLRIEWGFF